jgi:hypothetical protein
MRTPKDVEAKSLNTIGISNTGLTITLPVHKIEKPRSYEASEYSQLLDPYASQGACIIVLDCFISANGHVPDEHRRLGLILYGRDGQFMRRGFFSGTDRGST